MSGQNEFDGNRTSYGSSFRPKKCGLMILDQYSIPSGVLVIAFLCDSTKPRKNEWDCLIAESKKSLNPMFLKWINRQQINGKTVLWENFVNESYFAG